MLFMLLSVTFLRKAVFSQEVFLLESKLLVISDVHI